jgi:hypothetical protein
MSSERRRVAALFAGLLGLCAAGAALAAPEDPDALIEQGKTLRKAGDDEGAYKFFLRAYNISKSARAAAQLGTCEYQLSRWVDAEAHLTEALKRANDPYIVKNRELIVEALRDVRTHLGHLEITGRPSGAEVEVGGRLIGRLPLPGPIRVATGEINVRVAAQGHRTERRDVNVEPGQLRRVTFELPTEAEAAASGSGSGEASGGDSGNRRLGVLKSPSRQARESSDGPPPDTGDSDEGPPAWRRPAGWVAAGVATVLAAGGVAALLVGKSRIDQFNTTTRGTTGVNGRCNANLADKGGGICPTLLEQGNEAKKLGYIALGGAAVAGITAAILIATSSQPEVAAAPRPGRLALQCAPALSADSRGALCALRF